VLLKRKKRELTQDEKCQRFFADHIWGEWRAWGDPDWAICERNCTNCGAASGHVRGHSAEYMNRNNINATPGER
jgi:hypothetical protein